MSGHSKWATIRRKKAVIDSKRGKVFTKLIREISVAARMGGGDIDANPRLRLAVAAAKAANMPQDNIQRAIKKGTGELEGVSYEEVSYEGYGPAGTAFFVDVVTDNRNRTVAEIRHLFTKSSSLGESGCVAWMFDRKGLVVVEGAGLDEDRLFEITLEVGADDIREGSSDEEWEVYTDPTALDAVREAVESAGLTVTSAQLTRVPKDVVPVTGKEASQVVRLVDALDDHDDVQGVYSNYDLSDDEMARLEEEGS